MSVDGPRVVVVWRGNPALGPSGSQGDIRYPTIIESLRNVGFDTRHVIYLDSEIEQVREVLADAAAVLVWADPIGADGDRLQLDRILCEVARKGVRVYAHPDTILKMGTKDVLYDTRSLSWSLDCKRYETFSIFLDQFPRSIASGVPRVLKQHRGNGGIGVWKVETLLPIGAKVDPNETIVRVQHAAPRDAVTEEISLRMFMDRMHSYFDGSGHLIDQAFASRVSEGMIRVYMVTKQVVGFARQYADRGEQDRGSIPTNRVFGIPSAKTMLSADEPEFGSLRRNLEETWIGEMQKILAISDADLPLLWDTDFLFGPMDSDGNDTFWLCEINVSCVSPFPESAPGRLAFELAAELKR